LEEIKKDLEKIPNKDNSNEQEIIPDQTSLNGIPKTSSNSKWG